MEPPAPKRAAVTCPCPPSQVLKILLHTCSQGSPQFVLQLKRNASFIREAAGNGLGTLGRAATAPWGAGDPRRASAGGTVPGAGSYPTWEHPPPSSLCVCSVLRAPRPPPRQQLEPEGASGCTGGCWRDRAAPGPFSEDSGVPSTAHTPLCPSLSQSHRTWPAFCSRMRRCRSPWRCPPGPQPLLVSAAPSGWALVTGVGRQQERGTLSACAPSDIPCASPGMGSSPSPCGSLQGFGFSSDKSGSGESWPGPHWVLARWELGQGCGGHFVPRPLSSQSSLTPFSQAGTQSWGDPLGLGSRDAPNIPASCSFHRRGSAEQPPASSRGCGPSRAPSAGGAQEAPWGPP